MVKNWHFFSKQTGCMIFKENFFFKISVFKFFKIKYFFNLKIVNFRMIQTELIGMVILTL